jgi:endoglycosylceramidase
VATQPRVPADEDAAQIATLGFDVARLQLSWKAIEPGHAGPNDPAICTPGPRGDPRQWDQAHADAYLDRVEQVVDALRRHGIGTLFQIAQYGYNDRFGGPPSHPDWAVCTDGLPITAGRGATAYTQPGVSAAARHFWENDVRGDLQGEYDRMLRALAHRFAGRPGVVGYELYNEPYDARAATPEAGFDGLVQCFYAGRDDPGLLADGSRPSCPAGVPQQGAIQAIRAEDADSVVHVQAHIFTNFAVATRMGPLPAANLVFNFHVYCLSEVVTQPQRTRAPDCADAEERAVDQAGRTRVAMASPREPGALPWFLSEFGYTSNEQTLRHMTELADRHHLGWAYFLWRADRGFDTSDNPGMLRRPDGTLRPAARILARPYPAALAGTPQGMSYDVERRAFELLYTPAGGATSEIVLPRYTYGADGACVGAAGARWRIRGDRLLVVRDAGADRVRVHVEPGRCGRSSTLPCTSRRQFGIRLHQSARDPLVRARVLVAGRRAAVRRHGRRLVALVDLRGRPRQRIVVRIRARTRSGRSVEDRRVYRTCRSARRRAG